MKFWIFIFIFFDITVINRYFFSNVLCSNTWISVYFSLHLTNETFYGWWLRYVHAMVHRFFSLLYICIWLVVFTMDLIHIHVKHYEFLVYWFDYYGSYSFFRIYITLRSNEFLGSIVITTLIGAIPFVGPDILYLLWGSFSVSVLH